MKSVILEIYRGEHTMNEIRIPVDQKRIEEIDGYERKLREMLSEEAGVFYDRIMDWEWADHAASEERFYTIGFALGLRLGAEVFGTGNEIEAGLK